MKVRLEVEDTGGDSFWRYVAVLKCRGKYLGDTLPSGLWECMVVRDVIEPRVGAYVEFSVPPMDTFYVAVSSDKYWSFRVYVEGQYITTVLCNKDHPVAVHVGGFIPVGKKYYVLELVFMKVPNLYNEGSVKSAIEAHVVPIIEGLGYAYEHRIDVKHENNLVHFFVLFSGQSPAVPWQLIAVAVSGAVVGAVLLYMRWYELHVEEKELEVIEEYSRTQQEVIEEAKKLHDEGKIDDKTYQEILNKVAEGLAEAGKPLSKQEQEDTAKKLLGYITEWLPTVLLILIILEVIRTFRR